MHLYPHFVRRVLGLRLDKVFVSPTTPLEYRQGLWYFAPHSDKQHIFSQHRIVLQAGIFFVMALSSEKSRHMLVVFFDQIQDDDFKWLMLLEKIVSAPIK